MRRLAWLVLACLAAGAPSVARAQREGLLRIDDPVYHFLRRQQTAGNLPSGFLNHRPLSAYEANSYLDTLAAHPERLGMTDRRLLGQYRGASPAPGAVGARGLLPFAYRNGSNLFSFEGDGYVVHVDPLLNLTYGRAFERRVDGSSAKAPVWSWERGARVAGHVGRFVFFETRLTDYQRRVTWSPASDIIAPRLGLVTVPDTTNLRLYGGFRAEGGIGVRTDHFEVRFVRDRNVWGPGTTSLFLSDFATDYDQLQIRTTLGRFQYVNLFAGLGEPRLQETIHDRIVPRKYAAFHQLSVRLSARVELAFFESVIFATDTLGARKSFDLSYLNPVIFYRAVERDRGSPDNVLIGVAARWGVVRGFEGYGQFLLDELDASKLGTGWWGHKWGWLLGIRVADWPVSDLSIEMSYARLRPFLYSHRSALNSYVHFNDLLGYPSGPNSVDAGIFLRYRPLPRVHAAFTMAYTRRGRDTPDANYGSDPLRSYDTRVADFVPILSGVRQRYLLVEASAGYELLPGLYAEAAVRAESLDDALSGLQRYTSPYVILRWNQPFESVRY